MSKQAPSQPASAPPLYSMTGFARHRERLGESLGWTLVLKAVNHRFLDLHMRMPAGSEALEMQLRRELKSVISRGHLEVTLTIERTSQQQVEMDHGSGRQLHRGLPHGGSRASPARNAQPADHPAASRRLSQQCARRRRQRQRRCAYRRDGAD